MYATGYSKFGGNGRDPRDIDMVSIYNGGYRNHEIDYSWKEIKILMNKNIIAVKVGYDHSLFLQDDGNVWCCGNNSNGELGLGHRDWIFEPVVIPYFERNKIRIKMLECGSNHHLALSFELNVYGWGNNKNGQCGDDEKVKYIDTPKLIEEFIGVKVKGIDCGSFHSYCVTMETEENEKHYLFGSNGDNECITYDERDFVFKPFCIDDMIEKYCDGKKILSVSLGHYNTKIIVS